MKDTKGSKGTNAKEISKTNPERKQRLCSSDTFQHLSSNTLRANQHRRSRKSRLTCLVSSDFFFFFHISIFKRLDKFICAVIYGFCSVIDDDDDDDDALVLFD
jgi:hypothetical protein